MSNSNTPKPITVARLRAIGRSEFRIETEAADIVASAPADLGPADCVWHALGMLDTPRAERPRQTDENNALNEFGKGFDRMSSAVRHARNAEKVAAETDWLALAVQAASNARDKGSFSPDVIVAAIEAALAPVEEVADAA